MKRDEILAVIKDCYTCHPKYRTPERICNAVLAWHEKEIKEVLEMKGKPAKTLSYYEQGYNACLKEVKSKLKEEE